MGHVRRRRTQTSGRASDTVPGVRWSSRRARTRVLAMSPSAPTGCSALRRGLLPRRLQSTGIRQSMGQPGSALDNAAIESWHSTVTFELLDLEHFATKVQARHRVAAWIDECKPYFLRLTKDANPN